MPGPAERIGVRKLGVLDRIAKRQEGGLLSPRPAFFRVAVPPERRLKPQFGQNNAESAPINTSRERVIDHALP